MKKVLFATTALVASAGIASADVAISGSAEMGIAGGDNMETTFWTDIDVAFKMTGETDSGLTFGAVVDLDENGAFAGGTQGGEYVYISGSFGTLTMGDTDGAMDWAMTEVAIGGSIADDHTGHGGYNGNSIYDGDHDGQIARYDYSFDSFSFAASVELDDTLTGAEAIFDDPTFQIGVKYSGDLGGVTVGVGLGYAQSSIEGNDQSAFGVSLSAASNGFTGIINYSDLGDSDRGGVSETHLAIGLGYTTGAVTIGFNWGQYEEGANSQDGYGLAVNYDLGGGAVVQFGYGSTQNCGVYAGCATGDTFSLGVAMSF